MTPLSRAALVVAVLLAPGCGGGSATKESAAKVLRVGSDIEYAPIEFYKENGQDPQGLDIDLARALGAKLGMAVTFVNDTDFAGIIGALRAGRFDIVMSAMNDTPERRGKGVDFIDYFRAGSAILVQKGTPKQVKGLDDLCGATVSVQKGTTQDTDALQQVKNGRAVADLEDFPVAAYNAATSGGGADFEVIAQQVGAVGVYGIAVPADNTALRNQLQGALRAIIDDGTYDTILGRWNITAGALKTTAVNGGA